MQKVCKHKYFVEKIKLSDEKILEKLRPSGYATVDGRNPAPVDRYFIPLFTGLCTSQVVQDFLHQQ